MAREPVGMAVVVAGTKPGRRQVGVQGRQTVATRQAARSCTVGRRNGVNLTFCHYRKRNLLIFLSILLMGTTSNKISIHEFRGEKSAMKYHFLLLSVASSLFVLLYRLPHSATHHLPARRASCSLW